MLKKIGAAVVWVGMALSGFAAEKYSVDGVHSSVGFSVRHLGVSNVKGSFPTFTGTLMLDEKNMDRSSVEIAIDVSSVDTHNEKRDEHLRGSDFFDTAKFPNATFKSREVKKTATGLSVSGDLTLRGVTKTVEIPFLLSGPTPHPMMPVDVVGIDGAFKIDRRDFGITYGPAPMIGNEVSIDLQVEFHKPRPGKK